MPLRARRRDFGEAERIALSRILDDPLFKAAAEIALHAQIPPASILRQLPDFTQAAIGNQIAGARTLLDGLTELASPEPEAPDEGHDPWAHIDEERETFDTHL